MRRLGKLSTISMVGGVQEVQGTDKSPLPSRASFIENVSKVLESGLEFETEEPIEGTEEEAVLRSRLRDIDEAQRRSEFESRESYVS